MPKTFELAKKIKPNLLWGSITFALIIMSLLQLNKISEFLYFQF